MPTFPDEITFNPLTPPAIKDRISAPLPPNPVSRSFLYGITLGFVVDEVSLFNIALPAATPPKAPSENSQVPAPAIDTLISSSNLS